MGVAAGHWHVLLLSSSVHSAHAVSLRWRLTKAEVSPSLRDVKHTSSSVRGTSLSTARRIYDILVLAQELLLTRRLVVPLRCGERGCSSQSCDTADRESASGRHCRVR